MTANPWVRRWFHLLLVSAFLQVAGASAGWAQQDDRCRDVLRSGTMTQWQYAEHAYFQQLIYQEFLRSSYEESRRKKAFGLDVPIGDYVLGANYTREHFDAKKEHLRQIFQQQKTASRDVDVALSTGDPVIVSAWASCMRDRNGGLSIRLEPMNPREVNVILEWFPGAGVDRVRLTEAVQLPEGAEVKGPGRCFRRRAEFRASARCIETVVLPSALTTLNLVAKSTNGDASAYLAPRLVRSLEEAEYPFMQADKLDVFVNHGYHQRHEQTITLSHALMRQGWRFDPSTLRAPLVFYHNPGGPNSCWEDSRSATASEVKYGYTMHRHNIRRYPIGCRMEPVIKMVRDTWVSADSVSHAFTHLAPAGG